MRCTITLLALLATMTAAVDAPAQDQSIVTMDEGAWVAFYDVPSRRFRDVRTAFVRREFAAAKNDLGISAIHIEVEATRAVPVLGDRLADIAERLTFLADNIEDAQITLSDLDAAFGRAHWLLAQHYLDMARRSRDAGQDRNAGRYLWATTHHMERAVLWSNSRVDRELHRTLEGLRTLGTDLQDPAKSARAYREKPIVRADKVLRRLGKELDRPVVLPAPAAAAGPNR